MFVAAGAEVVALDIDAAALATLPCRTHAIDLTDAAAVAAFASGTGAIDILFLCAGVVETGTILDCDETAWARSFDLNVTAMYRMVRALLPGMVAGRAGSIIIMASVASSLRGVPQRFAYASTKAAIGLTKAIAADFAADGIRCNAILPGNSRHPVARRADARHRRPCGDARGLYCSDVLARQFQPTKARSSMRHIRHALISSYPVQHPKADRRLPAPIKPRPETCVWFEEAKRIT